MRNQLLCASALLFAAHALAQGGDPPKVPAPMRGAQELKAAPTQETEAEGLTKRAIEPRQAAPVLQAATTKTAAPAPAVPVLVGPLFDEQDGRLWVWQPAYKMALGDTGTHFSPRVGAGSDSIWVEFGAPSVQVGASTLDASGREVLRTDARVAYDRGGFEEFYDLAEGHVEQGFRFDRLPVRGEMRIAIPLAGNLEPRLSDGEVHFGTDAVGVRYGRAVAIDAAGERVDVITTISGGTIVLTVPETFVRRAVLPLIVDPIIRGQQPIGASAMPLLNPDIAYLASVDAYFAVYQLTHSATDQDVFGLLLDGDAVTQLAPFAIDLTSNCWERPRVASNEVGQSFMVVAQVSANCASPFWVSGRTVRLNFTLSPVIDIAKAGIPGHASADKLRPDVGGDPSPFGPTYYTVVWEWAYLPTDHDIHVKQVTTADVLRSPLATVIDGSNEFESAPSISKSDGVPPSAQQQWGIVYQRTYNGAFGPEEDIRGAFVSWDGQIQFIGVGPTFSIDGSAFDDRNPAISSPTDVIGAPREYMVVYDRSQTGNGDIMGVVLDVGRNTIARDNLTQVEFAAMGGGQFPTWPQDRPRVDSDGCRFVVAYREFYNGTADSDVRASTFAVNPSLSRIDVHDARAPMGTSNAHDGPPALVSCGGSGGYTPYHAVVWAVDDTAGSFSIETAQYGGYGPGLIYSMVSTGCGSLNISVDGLAALGTPLTFQLTGAPGFAGFVLGAPVFQPIGPCAAAGCAIGVQGDTSSGTSLNAIVPCSLNFLGAQFAIQGFSFGPQGSGPCFGQLQLSDTIAITVR